MSVAGPSQEGSHGIRNVRDSLYRPVLITSWPLGTKVNDDDDDDDIDDEYY